MKFFDDVIEQIKKENISIKDLEEIIGRNNDYI